MQDHADAGEVNAKILAQRADGSDAPEGRLVVDRHAMPLNLQQRRMRDEFLELPQPQLIICDSAQRAQRIASEQGRLLAPRLTRTRSAAENLDLRTHRLISCASNRREDRGPLATVAFRQTAPSARAHQDRGRWERAP